MRIEIEIPKEFDCDYYEDRFKYFFARIRYDISCGIFCGKHEREIVEMLAIAFENSKITEE